MAGVAVGDSINCNLFSLLLHYIYATIYSAGYYIGGLFTCSHQLVSLSIPLILITDETIKQLKKDLLKKKKLIGYLLTLN